MNSSAQLETNVCSDTRPGKQICPSMMILQLVLKHCPRLQQSHAYLSNILLYGGSCGDGHFFCLSLLFNKSSIPVYKLSKMCQKQTPKYVDKTQKQNNLRNLVGFNLLRFLFTIRSFNLFQHEYRSSAQKPKLHFKKRTFKEFANCICIV